MRDVHSPTGRQDISEAEGGSRRDMPEGAGRFLFVGGPHRSGTTMLAALLAAHPQASGLVGTGAYMDEGQFVQQAYPTTPALQPGFYAVEPGARLTELDGCAARSAAESLRASWQPYWQRPDARLLVEKSPPNMLRSRYLSSVFPDALQVFVLRDPLVVALATQKWSYTSITATVHHTILSYRTLFDDLSSVSSPWTVVRYESLVHDPDAVLRHVFGLANVDPDLLPQAESGGLRRSSNDSYLQQVAVPRLAGRRLGLLHRLRPRVRRAGYELASTWHEVDYVRKAFVSELEGLGYAGTRNVKECYVNGDVLPSI